MDIQKIGKYILKLRKQKNITQKQLGERLNVSYQAVSKWERGETLPDTMLLLELAVIFETSVDNILRGGETIMDFKKTISIKEIKMGIYHLCNLGNCIGRDNIVYSSIIKGINEGMVIDAEECFNNKYKREALVVEVIVQNIMNGAYVDLTDADKHLTFDHWKNIVKKYAKKHGIK
ncbi:MAG: helix-turn-helix transcriptional regulator [Candidatus Delongbacteria bacterium]|jgi:transcriptional regulator with XRE-family HTH domain|nr:helix-turn-helix transcriptional regulator [Candidatus Delongbacteria bacterium]